MKTVHPLLLLIALNCTSLLLAAYADGEGWRELSKFCKQLNATTVRRVTVVGIAGTAVGAVSGLLVGACVSRPIKGFILGALVGASAGAWNAKEVLTKVAQVCEEEARSCEKDGGIFPL